MFIFYFLGVGLPCRSIFCQFWLCEEAQCVYLRLHLGSLPSFYLLKFEIIADSQEIVKKIQRDRMNPSPSFPQWLHLMELCYNSKTMKLT